MAVLSGVVNGYATPTALTQYTNNRWSGSGAGYDAAGNQTALPARTYTYDAENRLVATVGPNIGAVKYGYDGDGRRVTKLICPSLAQCPRIDWTDRISQFRPTPCLSAFIGVHRRLMVLFLRAFALGRHMNFGRRLTPMNADKLDSLTERVLVPSPTRATLSENTLPISSWKTCV